jgi:uncharacterized protein YjbI with pentapeptide repeats
MNTNYGGLHRVVSALLFICFSHDIGNIASARAVHQEYAESYYGLPGEKCKIGFEKDWTEQEKWVWMQLCEGRKADLNQRDGRKLDPGNIEFWPRSRILRPTFLESILLHEPYRTALAHSGVRIEGAWFVSSIDMSDAIFTKPVALVYCRFEKDITLAQVQTSHWISLESSNFNGALDLNGIQIGGNLFMDKGATFHQLQLQGAKIGNKLHLVGSTFNDTVHMNRLQVVNSVYMDVGTTFQEVTLSGAQIGDVLDLTGAIFKGVVYMNNLEVGANMFMEKTFFHEEVQLSRAKIGSELVITGATFLKALNMARLHVNGPLFMEGGRFSEVDIEDAKVDGALVTTGSAFGKTLKMNGLHVGGNLVLDNTQIDGKETVYLRFSEIGSNFDISDSSLPFLDLTGTKIKGEFRLGSKYDPSAKGLESGVKLTLRNTEVGVLQDLPTAWPKLDLDGFMYGHLGGLGGESANDIARRDIGWFKEWLKKQQPYSPQPYEQLASVILKAGHKDKAKEILYESKERQRTEVAKGTDWLWLTILKLFIGYGYRTIFYLVCWVMTFTGIGVLLLKLSKKSSLNYSRGSDRGAMPQWIYKYRSRSIVTTIEEFLPLIAYSFDRFLPLVRLREYNYSKIELRGWLVYYFYFHQMMGFILASLLIAGVTGLAEK